MFLMEVLVAVVLVMICGPIVLTCVGAVLDGDWSGVGFLVAVGVVIGVLTWMF